MQNDGFQKRLGTQEHEIPAVVRELPTEYRKKASKLWTKLVNDEEDFPPVRVVDHEDLHTALANEDRLHQRGELPVRSDSTGWSRPMDVHSFEPSIHVVWDDLHEFYYAAAIHAAFLNASITQTFQRMSAMEIVSKNAGEILEKLTPVQSRPSGADHH